MNYAYIVHRFSIYSIVINVSTLIDLNRYSGDVAIVCSLDLTDLSTNTYTLFLGMRYLKLAIRSFDYLSQLYT